MEKTQWFFGTEPVRKNAPYNVLVAYVDEHGDIALKESQIPNVACHTIAFDNIWKGQASYELFPKLKSPLFYCVNKLRKGKDDYIILGRYKPRKGHPYVGYRVTAESGNIVISKFKTKPLKKVCMPYLSRTSMNKQLFFCVSDDDSFSLPIQVVQ